MAVLVFILLAVTANRSWAQVTPSNADVLAVYQALVRDERFGLGALSDGAVTIRRETHLFAIYVSARLLSWEALPTELGTALLASREPAVVPSELGEDPRVSVANTRSCRELPEDVQRRQIFLTPVGFAYGGAEAATTISNCQHGWVVRLRRTDGNWKVVEALAPVTWPGRR